MPTIKTKKEMNLPQLIEWGCKNEIVSKEYRCNEDDCKKVVFSIDGNISFSTFQNYSANDTFTVEIKEEITEDTKLFLISRCIGEFGNVSYLYNRTTINRRLDNLPGNCKITHFYIENDNKELVLIWTKEKGLVE